MPLYILILFLTFFSNTVAEEISVSELDKDLKTLISTWKEGIKKIKKSMNILKV